VVSCSSDRSCSHAFGARLLGGRRGVMPQAKRVVRDWSTVGHCLRRSRGDDRRRAPARPARRGPP
jgi:hypothetical protein